MSDEPLWIGFVGYAGGPATAAHAFEDRVLALLAGHGGHVVARGRRRAGQPDTLPAELHILEIPSQAAFEAFLVDPDRVALLDEFGEVFTSKIVVELERPTIQPPTPPPAGDDGPGDGPPA